jgi:hypothetical protein
LWCRKKGQDGCTTSNLKWAEGTECDYGKHCIQGQCVYKSAMHREPVDGDWSLWSEWSECSRTCGGGIRRSLRSCTNPEPKNGGKLCKGDRIRYESCNSHSCGSYSIDFRDIQCRRAAANPLKQKYLEALGYSLNINWKAYYSKNLRDKCKLMCSPFGSDRSVQLGSKVEDGTKCDLETNDICVDGVCLPGGCDNVLYSQAKYDNCFVCNGDNSSCDLVESTYEAPITYGYHDVVVIPEGSTNIHIVRNRESEIDDGFLSVSTETQDLLNCRYVVTKNSIKDINVPEGGTLEYIFGSQEIIKSHGIVGSELIIQFLGEDSRNGPSFINVKYYKPKKTFLFKAHYQIDVNRAQVYYEKSLTTGEWIYEHVVNETYQEACSRECQGEMRIKQKCIDKKSNREVHEQFCDAQREGDKIVPCNTHCRFM